MIIPIELNIRQEFNVVKHNAKVKPIPNIQIGYERYSKINFRIALGIGLDIIGLVKKEYNTNFGKFSFFDYYLSTLGGALGFGFTF